MNASSSKHSYVSELNVVVHSSHILDFIIHFQMLKESIIQPKHINDLSSWLVLLVHKFTDDFLHDFI